MHIRLTEEDFKGKFSNEYEAAKAAQDGNNEAWMLLWKHYRPMLMSRICHAKGFTTGELESEAIVLFAHKLKLFNRDKVTTPEGYSMHSWLFLGAANLNNKLIRQRKKEVHLYNEQVSAAHNEGGGGVHLPPSLCMPREPMLWRRTKGTSLARRRQIIKGRSIPKSSITTTRNGL